MVEQIKEKLQYSIEYSYSVVKDGTHIKVLSDEELEEVEKYLNIATKEELIDLIKVYHKEVKRIKRDIKEIIENE